MLAEGGQGADGSVGALLRGTAGGQKAAEIAMELSGLSSSGAK